MIDQLCNDPVLLQVAAAFNPSPHRLFLVGGSVRDALLGRLDPDEADLDFTTDADCGTIRQLLDGLGTVYDVGERFGTIAVAVPCPRRGSVKVEVTRHRRDAYNPDSRKPVVSFGDRIEDDLLRRDLTINAIAIEVGKDGKNRMVDPFDGCGDLERGVLRSCDDPVVTVREDPLRQLRAVRFAARFAMRLDDTLTAAIRQEAGRLTIVAAERCADELRKILDLGAERSSRALRLLADLGLGQAAFQGLELEAAAATIENLGDVERDDLFAVLADTAKDPGAAFERLKLSGAETKPALAVAACCASLRTDGSKAEARRIVRQLGATNVDRARRIVTADKTSGSLCAAVTEVRNLEPQLQHQPLPVDGTDLLQAGLRGKEVGEALRRIETAFCQNPALDRDTALGLIV